MQWDILGQASVGIGSVCTSDFDCIAMSVVGYDLFFTLPADMAILSELSSADPSPTLLVKISGLLLVHKGLRFKLFQVLFVLNASMKLFCFFICDI